MQTSRIELLKKQIAEQEKQNAASPKKDGFKAEIAAARANHSPAKAAANETVEGADLTVRDDAAERKARKDAMNARVAAMAEQQKANADAKKGNVSALKRDGQMFSGESKARFAERKAAVVSAMQKMSADTRKAVVQRLNIGHLLVEANPLQASIEIIPNSNMQQATSAVASTQVKSPAKAIQMISASMVDIKSDEQSMQVVQNAPEQSATFAEFFNFDSLCKAAIAHVPEGHQISNEEVTQKLNLFLQVAESFEVDALLQFIKDHKNYDDLLEKMRKESERSERQSDVFKI